MTTAAIDKLESEAPSVLSSGRRRLLLALFVVGLGAAAVFILFASGLLSSSSHSSPRPCVHFLRPGWELTLTLENGAAITLNAPEEIENYRFLGWRTEDGRLLNGQTLHVDHDELAEAEWITRDQIAIDEDPLTLTSTLMQEFRKGNR